LRAVNLVDIARRLACGELLISLHPPICHRKPQSPTTLSLLGYQLTADWFFHVFSMNCHFLPGKIWNFKSLYGSEPQASKEYAKYRSTSDTSECSTGLRQAAASSAVDEEEGSHRIQLFFFCGTIYHFYTSLLNVAIFPSWKPWRVHKFNYLSKMPYQYCSKVLLGDSGRCHLWC
jgi:hypothetical protein